MDFTPNEDQQAMIDLAGRLVGDHCDPDRLRRLEAEGASIDGQLWSALVDADLVALALPAEAGGGGYGILEAALVCEAVGRGPAMVPYAEVVAAGRAVGRAGDAATTEIVAGRRAVPAVAEGPTAGTEDAPTTAAEGAGAQVRLRGEKHLVPAGLDADLLVVSARDDKGPALYAVDTADLDPEATVASTSTTGQPLVSYRFTGTPARRLAGDGAAAVDDLRHDLTILRCAQLAGVAAGALDLTARHATTREQFGAPIGTFQAVAHRLADAWLDTNLMQATTRQAAWRTDGGYAASQATASAALWACEGVQRVVHAAQHVHGGIGMDLEYPVHRYFRWAKQVELQLGGASANVRHLGRLLADEPLAIG